MTDRENGKVQRCPICYGKGIVSAGFYSTPGFQWSTTSASPEKCRSCNGMGVVNI